MIKILDSFASNFQKGGIPFLIFIGVLGYVFLRLFKAIMPDDLSADAQAEKEIQEAVKNQSGVKDAITTQDRLIADRLHTACDGIFKQNDDMLEIAKSILSATQTKRIFAAYGTRPVSILWFAPENKNLVSAIMDKYVSSSDVGKVYTKLFKSANLM